MNLDLDPRAEARLLELAANGAADHPPEAKVDPQEAIQELRDMTARKAEDLRIEPLPSQAGLLAKIRCVVHALLHGKNLHQCFHELHARGRSA